MDKIPARDGPVACEAGLIRGKTWHVEKVMSPDWRKTDVKPFAFGSVPSLFTRRIGLLPFVNSAFVLSGWEFNSYS